MQLQSRRDMFLTVLLLDHGLQVLSRAITLDMPPSLGPAVSECSTRAPASTE